MHAESLILMWTDALEFRGPGGQGLEFGSGGGRSGAHLYGRGNPAFVWQNDGRDRPAFLPDQAPKRRQEIMDSCMVWEERVMQADPCDIFYPGVRHGLEALAQRHRLFIVSNCQRGYIELLLEKRKFGNLDSGPCLLRRNRPVQRGDHSPFDEAQ